MKIAVASDHGGYILKEKLIKYLNRDYEVQDFGTDSEASCDYPVFAKRVSNAVLNEGYDRGILICGTGIGMAIAANRFKGIRAANVFNTDCARLSREHNNSNVLTLGARIIDETQAKEIVDVWLNSDFQGERHQRRINMLDE